MTPKDLKKWKSEVIQNLDERVKSIKKNGDDFILIVSDKEGIKRLTNMINKFYRYGLMKGLCHQDEINEIEGRVQFPQIIQETRGLMKEFDGENNTKIKIKEEVCQKKRK
jgi:hypothetical protein